MQRLWPPSTKNSAKLLRVSRGGHGRESSDPSLPRRKDLAISRGPELAASICATQDNVERVSARRKQQDGSPEQCGNLWNQPLPRRTQRCIQLERPGRREPPQHLAHGRRTVPMRSNLLLARCDLFPSARLIPSGRFTAMHRRRVAMRVPLDGSSKPAVVPGTMSRMPSSRLDISRSRRTANTWHV